MGGSGRLSRPQGASHKGLPPQPELRPQSNGGHFVYSIVGDCANTASRVEGLNKHIGTQLLATESVVAGLDNILVRAGPPGNNAIMRHTHRVVGSPNAQW